MRLGTQTGSLVNHILTTERVDVPNVGDAATICRWSDRSPATVVSVTRKGKSVIVAVQCDFYTRTDSNGLSESQTYDYAPNPEGAVYFYKLKKDGSWAQVHKNENGRFVLSRGAGIYFGHRERYYDFTF